MIFGIGVKPGAGKGLALAIMWTLFSLWMFVGLTAPGRERLRSIAWKTVPCVIEKFEVTANTQLDPVFQTDLKFRYQWNGQEHVGSDLWAGQRGDDQFDEVSRVMNQIRTESGRYELNGIQSECRVSPSDPGLSCLRAPRSSDWSVLFVALFAGSFVMIGFFLVVMCLEWRPKEGDWISYEEKGAHLIVYTAAGFFLLIGVTMLGALVAPAVWNRLDSLRWDSAPAKVLWTDTFSRRAGKGTSVYRCVFYCYEYQGVEYHSSRYDLMGYGSRFSDEDSRLAPTSCRVDPSRPWMAALDCRLGGKIWLGLLMGGAFVTVSSFMIIHIRRKGKTVALPIPDRPKTHGGKRRKKLRGWNR